MRVLRTQRPGTCNHRLPGWRERHRLGLRRGAQVCCDQCHRVYEYDPYDGIGWYETTPSKILHPR